MKADESRKQYPPNAAEEIELLWMAAAGSSPATKQVTEFMTPLPTIR